MTREELLQSAARLKPVGSQAQQEYSRERNRLVDEINKRMSIRLDLTDLIGENHLELMHDNHANHARFMESVFFDYSPEVLVNTILWVFRAYGARNFSTLYWAAQLNTWITLYREELSAPCFEEIYPYYAWMQTHIPVFTELSGNND